MLWPAQGAPTTRLSVALLGSLQVTLDGMPVTHFESARVHALLALLAAEAGRPHRREAIAELLWPKRPPGAALADLRHALASLRKTIADASAQPPFLLITPTTLQFNFAIDATVDLADFMACLSDGKSATPTACHAALALRRGPFLAGFSLAGSAQFEEWLLVTAEHVNHLAGQALACLVRDALACGDFAQAAHWTRQQLALEPWNKEVHRRAHTLLRLVGGPHRRAAAVPGVCAHPGCGAGRPAGPRNDRPLWADSGGERHGAKAAARPRARPQPAAPACALYRPHANWPRSPRNWPTQSAGC